MPIRTACLIALAVASAACADRPVAIDVSCRWRGTGQFAEYATDARARLSDGRLTALRIVSKVGAIPDRSEGTCVYDLRRRRFEHGVGDDGTRRLRFVNDRNEGTGYLDYRVSGKTLIVEHVSSYACANGSLVLPIEMSSDPGACRVGAVPAH